MVEFHFGYSTFFRAFSHNYTLPWVNCHSGVITFVSSIVLNLFNANLSSFKLVSRTNLIYKKQFRIFFLVCQPLFKSFFVNVCLLIVRAGTAPTSQGSKPCVITSLLTDIYQMLLSLFCVLYILVQIF